MIMTHFNLKSVSVIRDKLKILPYGLGRDRILTSRHGTGKDRILTAITVFLEHRNTSCLYIHPITMQCSQGSKVSTNPIMAIGGNVYLLVLSAER